MKLLLKMFNPKFICNIIFGKGEKIEKFGYFDYASFIGVVGTFVAFAIWASILGNLIWFTFGAVSILIPFIILFWLIFLSVLIGNKRKTELYSKVGYSLTDVEWFNNLNEFKKRTILTTLMILFFGANLLFMILLMFVIAILPNCFLMDIIFLFTLINFVILFGLTIWLKIRFLINIVKMTFLGLFSDTDLSAENMAKKTKTTKGLKDNEKEELIAFFKNMKEEDLKEILDKKIKKEKSKGKKKKTAKKEIKKDSKKKDEVKK